MFFLLNYYLILVTLQIQINNVQQIGYDVNVSMKVYVQTLLILATKYINDIYIEIIHYPLFRNGFSFGALSIF